MSTETTPKYVIILSNKFANPYRVYLQNTWSETDGVNTSRIYTKYVFCRGYKMLDTAQRKFVNAEYIGSKVTIPHGGAFNIVESTRYLNGNVFPYGKYKGQLISNCDDIDYLYWFQTTLTDTHTTPMRVNVDLRINQLEGQTHSLSANRGRQISVIKKLALSNPEITCDTNIKIDILTSLQVGAHAMIEDVEIFVEFDNYNTYYYAGYPYGLPLDKKGKSKRIKGKTIILKDFKYEFIANGNVLIKVSDWEIKK